MILWANGRIFFSYFNVYRRYKFVLVILDWNVKFSIETKDKTKNENVRQDQRFCMQTNNLQITMNNNNNNKFQLCNILSVGTTFFFLYFFWRLKRMKLLKFLLFYNTLFFGAEKIYAFFSVFPFHLLSLLR